ncbi:MAG: hypothetical protein K0Q66_1737, partial [Chitinophagaceae bacterium]|nr:hypothetical protein [Chitinophagaceae bacterium]
LFREECFLIVGLAMTVHNKLGKGFKEVVYKDALEIEFRRNNIPYIREVRFNIVYGETILRHKFSADFLVYDSIIIEAKATSSTPVDAFIQTLNYLKASTVELGIILNFGMDRLDFKRVICTY